MRTIHGSIHFTLPLLASRYFNVMWIYVSCLCSSNTPTKNDHRFWFYQVSQPLIHPLSISTTSHHHHHVLPILRRTGTDSWLYWSNTVNLYGTEDRWMCVPCCIEAFYIVEASPGRSGRTILWGQNRFPSATVPGGQATWEQQSSSHSKSHEAGSGKMVVSMGFGVGWVGLGDQTGAAAPQSRDPGPTESVALGVFVPSGWRVCDWWIDGKKLLVEFELVKCKLGSYAQSTVESKDYNKLFFI